MGNRAEGTCEHKSGHEKAPNSRSIFGLLTKVAHLFLLHFSVLFQVLLTRLLEHTTTWKAIQRTTLYGPQWPYISQLVNVCAVSSYLEDVIALT